MPPEVRAALDRATSHARPGGAEARVAAQGPELIHAQMFEDAQFPPDGWEVVDLTVATGDDAVMSWGRQTCENKPDTGSTAGAWSNGGGTVGGQATCWTPYTQRTDTWMVYGGIDATGYDGGLRVLFDAKVDPPSNNAFQMCWASATQQQPRCRSYNITGAGLEDKWWYPSTPEIAEAAGHQDVGILFWYSDPPHPDTGEPVGGNKGAIVDNIIIEGLAEPATPVPTSGSQNTPVPTAGPTQPPVPAGRRAYMPIAMKKADIGQLPSNPTAEPRPTSSPNDIDIQLGLEIDDTTGELVAPGTQFQFGIMQLGRMITWQNQEIGTPIRWQWYLDEQEVTGDINGQGTVQVPAGRVPQEIIMTDRATGDRLPIVRGMWRCDVWIGDVTTARPPDASASALISDEVPPGATTMPTPVPTLTPVPTATLEPGTWQCNDFMTNGDYEQGANVGWKMVSNLINSDTQEPLPIDAVIVDNSQFPTADPAYQGEWFARYPGVTQGQLVLYQDQPLTINDPMRVISSTIEFVMAFDSAETPDGQPSDTFQPVLVSEQPDDRIQYIPILPEPLSEESQPNQQWVPYSIQLTQNFWTTVAANTLFLGFLVENDDVPDTTTTFAQDVNMLNVCERTAAMSAAERRAFDARGVAPVVIQGRPTGQWLTFGTGLPARAWSAGGVPVLELNLDR